MTRGERGIIKKVVLQDKGGSGVQTPPKKMTSFANSPLLDIYARPNILWSKPSNPSPRGPRCLESDNRTDSSHTPVPLQSQAVRYFSSHESWVARLWEKLSKCFPTKGKNINCVSFVMETFNRL